MSSSVQIYCGCGDDHNGIGASICQLWLQHKKRCFMRQIRHIIMIMYRGYSSSHQHPHSSSSVGSQLSTKGIYLCPLLLPRQWYLPFRLILQPVFHLAKTTIVGDLNKLCYILPVRKCGSTCQYQ